jgi:DNA polymerase II small subunit
MLMKHIFDIFMKRDTLLHPDVVDYFSTQKDPMKYVNDLVENIPNLPMILTIEDVHNFENIDIGAHGGDESVIATHAIKRHSELSDAKADETDHYDNLPKTRMYTDKSEKGTAEPNIQLSNIRGDSSLSYGLMKSGGSVLGSVHDVGTPTEPSVPLTREDRPKVKDAVTKSVDVPDFKIISDITGRSTCEGLIKDFTRNIKHRFNTIKNIIRSQYRIFQQSINIEKINLNYKRDIFFIGMITSVNTTAKGNTIITMEDETGEIRVFLKQDDFKNEKKFLVDEVVGVIGETNMELKMVMAERIARPAPPRNRKVHRAADDVDVVFISDIHVGSCEFLEDRWLDFVSWLSGNSKTAAKVSPENVKYLVVAGDLVDGIGIYPDQEEELEITDIYKQYARLAELLADIPENIKLILAPGNHDAVRQAEPQPALQPEFQKYFGKNAVFVGNPCYMALHGVEILVYHGRSFDDIVKFIPEATYIKPTATMKEMLIRRHLVPIYGERTPIAPEHQDMLMLDRLPDIFVTGHVHTSGHEYYLDMLLINGSAWQAQTSFQKTLNFNPDPCKAYMVNLNSLKTTQLDFSARNF